MDIPASGADSWLTINGQPLSFHSEEDNLQVGAKEAERNFIRITNKAPDDLEIWVDDEQLEKARVAVSRLGLDVKPPRPRVDGEGQSLYFHDHDNHLFELHTGTLDERLARYGLG